jgi:hypothetical protein
MNDEPRPQVLLYTGGDATSVNIRGEGWKQPKVAVAYEPHAESASDRIKGRRYTAGFWEKDQFARRWKAITQDLAKGRGAQWIAIMDGAGYLWDLLGEMLPHAHQLIDWYHAKERVYTLAKLVWGEDQAKAQAWAQRTETLLWKGKVQEVIDRIGELPARTKEARDYKRQSAGYYNGHASRMDYPLFRRRGYRIGSGALEGGGCKNVVGDRFKRTGMRWSREGAHRTLQVRACLLDETLRTFWKDRFAISIP